jgi:DNA-directed RNA polymerase specialized sigma24 family protein
LTEIPYGTVVSRLHRGRQRLRHLLGATVPTIARLNDRRGARQPTA